MSANNCEKYRWTKYSENRLIEVENKILKVIKTAYKTWFVPVGSIVGTNDKIWTISLNQESRNTPLVLLHGFAAGLGFWCLNYDHVSKDRPVFAMDLLGFGRSSRPSFSSDSEQAEQELVNSIEEWRKEMNLEKFILLGHSFGGYLATSYAINHPERVKHLILADPWGFSERPPNFNPPLWIKALRIMLYPFTYFSPLAIIRAAGPAGPWLVRNMRSDIAEKYSGALEEREIISEYIYQCNSQKPSGESAFQSMMLKNVGVAKNPMLHRFDDIQKSIPITVIYGEQSWITHDPGEVLKTKRQDSYVHVEIIPGAGHHIHADQPHLFNHVVHETCKISDQLLDQQPNKISSLLDGLKIISEQKADEDINELQNPGHSIKEKVELKIESQTRNEL